jgi:hypothetical protein
MIGIKNALEILPRMLLTQVVMILVNSIFEGSAQLMSNDEPRCAGPVCLPSNYSRLIGPYNESSSFNIEVGLDVLQILEVNDQLFTVSLTMYFWLAWQDPRILSPPTDNPHIPIALSFMDHLWVPDVYFYNLKSTQTLNIISEFAGTYSFLLIDSFHVVFNFSVLLGTGLWVMNLTQLWYSQETHVTFWCPMRFEMYPLDHQVCLFQVGSYAHNDNILKFSHGSISYDESVRNTILDYSVEIVPLDEKDKTYVSPNNINYSLSGFEMRLKRNILKYVITYYFPSGLFVIVSWVIVIFLKLLHMYLFWVF